MVLRGERRSWCCSRCHRLPAFESRSTRIRLARSGRGAIVSAARVAVDAYESGGRPKLALPGIAGAGHGSARKLCSTPLSNSERETASEANCLHDSAPCRRKRLLLRARTRLAGFRFRSGRGQLYAFVTSLPEREATGRWSRLFLAGLILMGALMCYALARHVTLPMVYLRALTSRVLERRSDGARHLAQAAGAA